MKNNESVVVNINSNEIKKEIDSISTLPTITPIKTQESYTQAGELLKMVKSKLKELEEKRKSITKPLDDSKKQIMDLFRPAIQTLEVMERKIKDLMIEYTNEQIKKAKEEEERIKKLVEAEAEKQKKMLEKQMQKAEIKGNQNEVEKIKEKIEAVEETPIVVPIITPNIENKGISYREKWYAEVVDFELLPNEYKLPNQQALDKIAQATKGSAKIPGVVFKSEKIVVSRR